MILRVILYTVIVIVLVPLNNPVSAVTTIKIATLTPDGSDWMVKMREGGKKIEAATHQRVRLKFYPGGVMGDDKAVLRKIRIGQLHGGAFVSNSLSEFFPDNQIYGLPLMLKTYEEVDYVRKFLDPLISDGLKNNGFMTFGLAEGGFAHLMSQVEIRTIQDIRQQKVWLPDNDSNLHMAVRAFGVQPIPLSIADVLAGLQTGLINTVGTSPIGAIVFQWHTQIKYILDMPLLYIYAIFAIDKRVYDRLAPEDQIVVKTELEKVFKTLDQENRKSNIEAIDVLKKQGIEFIRLSDEEKSQWHQIADKIPDQLVTEGRLSAKMVELFRKHLAEFRAKKSKDE